MPKKLLNKSGTTLQGKNYRRLQPLLGWSRVKFSNGQHNIIFPLLWVLEEWLCRPVCINTGVDARIFRWRPDIKLTHGFSDGMMVVQMTHGYFDDARMFRWRTLVQMTNGCFDEPRMSRWRTYVQMTRRFSVDAWVFSWRTDVSTRHWCLKWRKYVQMTHRYSVDARIARWLADVQMT